MTQVIPLHEQVKALHPETGKPITIVGIDTSGDGPRLIVLRQSYLGIYAEVIDSADLPRPSASG